MDDEFKKNLLGSYLYIMQLQSLHMFGWTEKCFDLYTSIVALNGKIIWLRWKTNVHNMGAARFSGGPGAYYVS